MKINFSRYQTIEGGDTGRRDRSAQQRGFSTSALRYIVHGTSNVTFVFITGAKRLNVSSRHCYLRNVFTSLRAITHRNISIKNSETQAPLQISRRLRHKNSTFFLIMQTTYFSKFPNFKNCSM